MEIRYSEFTVPAITSNVEILPWYHYYIRDCWFSVPVSLHTLPRILTTVLKSHADRQTHTHTHHWKVDDHQATMKDDDWGTSHTKICLKKVTCGDYSLRMTPLSSAGQAVHNYECCYVVGIPVSVRVTLRRMALHWLLKSEPLKDRLQLYRLIINLNTSRGTSLWNWLSRHVLLKTAY